jgi:basic membrane lipoprotein Med (substrate-binding protein (PBP1-ABC) superfamily)
VPQPSPAADSDYISSVNNCAKQYPDLVITMGHLMQAAIGAVSGLYHTVHFAIIDGFGTDPQGHDLHHANVESLPFKEQEASALVGVIAAVLEQD